MASAIDPSRPADGVPAVKADLRANLLAAKNEIEALQRNMLVSVRDFGAKGDGATDDLPAIQNAIDSVSGNGGVVFFPGSDAPYLIDGTIQMKANVTLAGEYAGSIIKLADNANVDMILAQGALPHIGLRDLVLYGNRFRQNGDATKIGINWSLSNTSSGYTGNSTINGLGPTIMVDPFYKVERVLVLAVDGTGIRAVGAHGLWFGVDVLNVNSVGIRAQANDTQWVSCNVGATAHEGWLCAGGSARYTDCKSFFTGTGYNQQDETYGNYVNGHAYRITSRGQHFCNCQAQDNDGFGYSVQANDISIAGGYCDQSCQLPAWSQHLGQNPTRGGGFAQHKAPINLQGATNCIITGVLVTARGVVNNQISAGLDGIVRLHGSSSNNMVIVNYTDGVLKSGGAPVVKASYSGTNNTVLMPSSGLVSH